MSTTRLDDLRHDAPRRRAGARLLAATIDEKLEHGPAARRRWAWTSSRPGFPIASEADAEAVRMVATEVRGPVIAALARCTPADIDRAGWALQPAARRRIHIFIATSDLHLERKLRMSREACLDAAVAAVHRARRYTDDVQFSAEDATRSDMDFLCRVIEEVISAGCHHDQSARTPSATRRPTRSATFFRDDPDARAERRPRHLQRALPRRPRPGGGQHAGGGLGRRAPGGVHDQRHRRARRQRLARRDRDGDPRAAGSPALRDRRSRRRRSIATSQLLTALTGEARAGEQGHRRPQRVRARGRHPPGRDAQGPPHLRNHAAGGSRAFRRRRWCSASTPGRHAVQRRCEQLGITLDRHELDRIYREVIALADREKIVSDRDLTILLGRLRGTSAAAQSAPVHAIPDVFATPAESGYGHGV